MKTNNAPANVANLLTAAAYVRTETIINGTQAAKLDAMIEKVNELSEIVSEKNAWIADAESDGKNPTFAKRMLTRYKEQFADAVATLRAWLVDFKANRPNVQINLDEPEEPETPTDNTPATMNANETTEFSELTHAGQCLDIYLHNTREIYERYTVPAIERVTRAIKAGEYVSDNAGQLAKDIQEITPAMQAAARLVKRYDHLTPTANDIEQVTRNYAAYIVDCAKYEIENA